MEFSLKMNAAAHRLWYIGGDVVKVRLTLTCVPEAAVDAKREVVPLQAIPKHNYFSVDTSEAESHEVDLRVELLTAELMGSVELDASVIKPINWPAATHDVKVRPSSRPGSANSKVPYTLYSTGKKTLQEAMCLKRYQCVALEFVFRLPEGCPPTFAGKGADYRHVITVVATWQNARAGNARLAAPRSCKVRVPLLVFNCIASVAQLPLLSLFPLPSNAKLVREDFHFRALSLPSVPAPSIAVPLGDVMVPQESQLRTSLTVRRSAKSTTQNSLASQRQPLSLLMPCNGVNVLRVQLRSSCVALGDFLCGAFTVLDGSLIPEDGTVASRDRRRNDMDAPVPVTITAALELLECVTPEWAMTSDPESMSDTKAQGMGNFVCLHKRVIEHASFTMLDTPSATFEFSLPIGLVPASTITDITTFVWQLRVVVTAVARKALAQTASPGVDMLGPLLEPVAGVFPLLVVPPMMPAKGRQGQEW